MTPLRILGETAYPATVASARVRVAAFAPPLRDHDVWLEHRPTLREADYAVLASTASPPRKALTVARSALRAARTGPAHDLLLIHRLRLLTPVPGLDPPRRLDVYDLDDALFLGSTGQANRHWGWAKQEARRCVAYLRKARLVTAGNEYLAGRAREWAARVEVVPSCVDPESQPLREHADTDVVRIGWIGSQTTRPYVDPVLPVLARLNSERIRFRLVLIGAPAPAREPWIEERAWSAATQAAELSQFDIGIMPLPDTEWARGKCGYKLLQYFAAGVPAVASPVGVNPELIGSERGLLAASPEEWGRALTQLGGDARERRERGALARTYVERGYSYQRWAPELAALLRSIA